MKKLFLLFVAISLTFSLFSQSEKGKVFWWGETQCAYVIENNMIHESGSAGCTTRVPLYDIKDSTIYFHNSKNECAMKIVGGKIYFPSRNSNEIDRVMWVIKGNQLVYPDRQNDIAFIIDEAEKTVYFGSANKVKIKDRPILKYEGDVPIAALYMIIYTVTN